MSCVEVTEFTSFTLWVNGISFEIYTFLISQVCVFIFDVAMRYFVYRLNSKLVLKIFLILLMGSL